MDHEPPELWLRENRGESFHDLQDFPGGGQAETLASATGINHTVCRSGAHHHPPTWARGVTVL